MGNKFNSKLIAPCGMNCGICVAYLREKNNCGGCHSENCRGGCRNCAIKNCVKLKKAKSGFCADCEIFPCARIKKLDKRYRTKYGMSMIENLLFIKEKGMKKFLAEQNKKWICSDGIICVHDRKIYSK